MLPETTFIYTLSCPETGLVRYVGKANNPKKRYSRHLNENLNNKKNCWIKSLKNKNKKPILDIIDEVSINDWSFMEKHYIKLYKSMGAKLVNLNEGGGENYICSDETKQKMRDAKKGFIPSEKMIKASIEYKKNNPILESTRKKLSLINKGKPRHENFVKARIELDISRRKPVSSYDFNGDLVKSYDTANIASEETGIFRNFIIGVCNKRPSHKTANGLIWRYGKESKIFDVPKPRDSHNNKPVIKLDLNGNFLKEYESVLAACKDAPELKIDDRNIHACCLGKKKTCKGFIWKYKKDYKP